MPSPLTSPWDFRRDFTLRMVPSCVAKKGIMGVWGEGGSDMRYKVKTGQYNMKELFYLFTQGKSIFLSSIIDIGCPCLPFIFFFNVLLWQ